MDLKEQLFDMLVGLIENATGRAITDYRCLMVDDGFDSTYSDFEEYLGSEAIPFTASGVSFESRKHIPVISIDTATEKSASGLYLIYPKSEREIIIYFYHMLHVRQYPDVPRYILCFKKEEVMQQLFAGYRRFSAQKNRSSGNIYVHGGPDIRTPDIQWGDVILRKDLKEDIKRAIENFLSSGMLYKKLRIPHKRGFLFSGSPGNGKTMLLKAIAHHYADWKFIYFKCNVHSDNTDIDNVFDKAVSLAPSIICFEDLDSLFSGQITLSHFLNKLDGFEEREGTLVLATTNHPEEVDPALTSRPSRFDRVWTIGNPDLECRTLFLKKFFEACSDADYLDVLARKTEGFSMAYLKELCISASMLAIERGRDYPGENELSESLRLLSGQIENSKRQYSENVRSLGFAPV